jgi:hypothetical protein
VGFFLNPVGLSMMYLHGLWKSISTVIEVSRSNSK